MNRYVAIVLAALAAAGCSAESSDRDAAPLSQPQPVRSAPVKVIDTDRDFALSGVVRAADRAQLAFQVSGQLEKRPVAIGDEVAAGDLIGELSQPELGPSVRAARARASRLQSELEQAERDLARVQSLYDRDAATKQELESAQSRRDSLAASLDQARAEAERAQSTLGETRLTAPVDGTVSRVFFEPGEFVPAGRPVVALSGSGALEVEIGLPETLLDEVAVGDRARLELPLVGGETSGRVIELANAGGGPGRLFPAVLSLEPAPGLRPGVTVTWHLHSKEPDRLTVPVAAVASTGGRARPRVFRITDGHVSAVPVKLGAVVGERVVVDGDLAAGDRIVTLGLEGLVNGRAVTVRQ